MIQDNLLKDVSQSGKIRPWKIRKLQNLAVAQAMRLIDELNLVAMRLEGCGTYIHFKACPNGHGKKVCLINLCGCRGCMMCDWRKSLVTYHQVLAIVHEHKKQYKSDIPLLLTLTVPNCSAEELGELITKMLRAFHTLSKRKQFKNAVRGWFRAAEVTYNEEADTYHPHFHVLLMVPKNYFVQGRGLYISRDEWLEMWQQSMKDMSITQVDIRRVKKKKSSSKVIESVVAEVAKYATKPGSYIKKNEKGEFMANPKAVLGLRVGLKNKRLHGFGGTFKEIRKRLKLEDIEKADLIKVSGEEQECKCDICQSTLLDELYTWVPGAKNYVRAGNNPGDDSTKSCSAH
jgi:plasmid rolling circle replication initiator protein Rep